MALDPKYRFAYGAAGNGNLKREMSDEQSWQLLETAWDSGIRHYDTSPHYGIGLSERRLGEFLRTKPRAEYFLTTKVGKILEPLPEADGLDTEHMFHVKRTHYRRYSASESDVRRSLEESLTRMGLDRVDALYLHDPEQYGQPLDTVLADGLGALNKLKAEGLVAAVGVGSMSTEALTRGVRSGMCSLIMLAGRHTLLEQNQELLDALTETGTEAVAVSIYNSGLLAKPRPAADAQYEYAAAPAEIIANANKIADICENHGVDLPTAALAYPLRHPQIVAVGIGASKPSHITESAARFTAAVPEELWQDLVNEGIIPA